MLLSNSTTHGKSAYIASYVVIKGRAIGSVSLFGEKLQNFNVRIKDNKFAIASVGKTVDGFNNYLQFDVADQVFRGSDVLMAKAIEYVVDHAERYDMGPADIARLAILYYVHRNN